VQFVDKLCIFKHIISMHSNGAAETLSGFWPDTPADIWPHATSGSSQI